MLRFLISYLAAAAIPMCGQPSGESHVPLPVNLSGTLNGVEYRMQAPVNWNGTLLVYAHGTQIVPGSAEISPVAWPAAAPSVEGELLSLGYALAGSGFENSVKDGVQRTLALTNFFKGKVGNPSRIIVWGNSLGGLVTLKLIEEHPGIYDAGIANCAPAAGTPENMDWALAFGLAYGAAFGWRDDLWGPIEDLRDDVNFFTDVRPYVPWPPSYFGRWEFIRLMMRLPQVAFWGQDPQTNSFFFGLGMWKATAQRAANEAAFGGPVADNVGYEYTLETAEKTYLGSLGVNADELLTAMNGRANIAARRSARNHAEHWNALTGRLIRPVLTMHSIFDGLAPVYNESAYAAAVAEAGSSDRLVQAYVTDVGHCSFSAPQYLSAIAAMESWLNTGVAPDATALPASLHFNVGHVPPPWPF
jgi:pimeloyl-ACP methyl ester carboxylesterase